ncbi:MAG: hypothetical protein KAU14_02270, partial [Thermoplasmata archaeon]|nr:hypothetical protein [Thermoplasmata archaeon]
GRILTDYGHGNNAEHTSYYHELFLNRYLDDSTAEDITTELLDDCDVFISVGATTPYFSEEITAIQDFVDDGGGLFVIGDNDSSLYDDLTNYAGIYWTELPGMFGATRFINSHPITEGVDALYFDSPSNSLIPDQLEKIIVWDITHTTIQVAAAEYGKGRIVALVDDNCLDDEFIDERDNRLFGVRVGDWINNEVPVAVIDLPLNGSYHLTSEVIEFSASSSNDPDNNELSYTWTSNIDGEIGTTAGFSRTLSRGIHRITLEVDDNHGKTNTTEVSIVVNTPPVAVIDSPEDGVFYLTGTGISFDASSSLDRDGDRLSYLWNSTLDGEIGHSKVFGRSLSHGWHTISLIVDDGIQSDYTEIDIVVNSPPIPGILSPIENCFYLPDEDITFDA